MSKIVQKNSTTPLTFYSGSFPRPPFFAAPFKELNYPLGVLSGSFPGSPFPLS